ncbi:MAG: MSCRAMM family adhesin SdrC [Planctomycetes bacterium]|nr:MSCRAMM family adhesin SdrC [Planctomycetota bacterium]
MARKYLTLEEAAAAAGISTDELKQLRESGRIRGFADRGAWKFKPEDIEELGRSRQADSNPDVPILADDDDDELVSVGSSVVLAAADSSVGSSVLAADEDELGEQPTVVRSSVLDDEPIVGGGTSDSDVRLILDDSLAESDSDPEIDLGGLSDSDSDVRLVEDSRPSLVDSDSDVRLMPEVEEAESASDSDSDVKLVPSPAPGSDSDVRLVSDDLTQGSDSDVKLLHATSDSDVRLMPSRSGVGAARAAADDEEIAALSDDSGISLGAASDVALAAESGVSLESVGDSGIALDSMDSGIALSDDSITLGGDSGIALDAADSGIALDGGADSGIALDGDDDLHSTVPMLESLDSDDELSGTNLELPALEEDDSEFELAMSDEVQPARGGAGDTSVILFDDDEEIDDRAATVVKRGGDADLEEFDEFGAGDDFDEDLEVAEDVVGEDDELDDLDVFDADDADFDEGFETGASHAEFVAPAGVGAVPVAVEHEWGAGTFAGLLACTVLMALVGMMTFDLVRYMWHAGAEDAVFSSPLLDMFKDMI